MYALLGITLRSVSELFLISSVISRWQVFNELFSSGKTKVMWVKPDECDSRGMRVVLFFCQKTAKLLEEEEEKEEV